jgi:hypothetical protein
VGKDDGFLTCSVDLVTQPGAVDFDGMQGPADYRS